MEGLNKNSRRKRKDPQSRDFICKCQKSYLSYAAAYTHVKNKHDGQRAYLDSIQKPTRQNLKRGRPKQRRVFNNNLQTECLSVIQDAILKIYQQLKQNTIILDDNIILQGNQQVQYLDVKLQYQKITYKVNLSNIFQQMNKEQDVKSILIFENGLNKHFKAPIVAKIRFYLSYLYNKENIYSERIISDEQELSEVLWSKKSIINQIIEKAYHKWTELINREN